MTKYKLGYSVIVRNFLMALLSSIIVSAFLLMCVSESLFYCSFMEIISALAVSLGVSCVYVIIFSQRYIKKSFSIENNVLTFYYNDKKVKSVDLANTVGTEIFKAFLYRKNRKIYINTGNSLVRFTVSAAVYEQIKDLLPNYFKSKGEGLVEINNAYKLKTLAMRVCEIVFLSAIVLMIVSPVILGIVRNIPHKIAPNHLKVPTFYSKARRYYFISSLSLVICAILFYAGYFFAKYFIYKRYKIRVDDSMEIEYHTFSLQKRKYDKNLIVGIKQVKSVFSFLFGLEAVYLLMKVANGKELKTESLPFCLTESDVEKLKVAVLGESPRAEQKCAKSCYLYALFPAMITIAFLVFLSVLFSWTIMWANTVLVLYFLFYFKNRGYGIGDSVAVFSCGFIAKDIISLKLSEIEGITATKRFFEVKRKFSAYEILIYGYNGVFPLGVFGDELLAKIKEKL